MSSNVNYEEIIARLVNKYGEDVTAKSLEMLKCLNNKEELLSKKYNPVGIETFIKDPYFMGRVLDQVWSTVVESVENVINGGYTEAVFDGSIGRGKCFAYGTEILMYDNTVKQVQDIVKGDRVMGWDFRPRIVTGLARGRESLYDVKQEHGCNYRVNASHILSLRHKETNRIFNISVNEYLKLSEKGCSNLEGWRPEINFKHNYPSLPKRDKVTITKAGRGAYYGFEVYGGRDKMFLLPDLTVVHNTTRATIVCAYNLYRLSCYRQPQRVLGLMDNSDLFIAMINKSETLAKKVTYSKFRKLIEGIPYFQENFMFDKTVENEMRFPNNIFVIPSNADNENLLGMDVISGLVDEVNFYDLVENSKRSKDGKTFDQAVEVYNGLVRRITSRFDGLSSDLIGCMCVVSSRSHEGDFTDRKIKEVEELIAEGKDIKTYISTGSYWSFVPQYREDGTQRYSSEKFLVAIGNRKLKSEIIDDIKFANGRRVIEVPENFFEQFRKDIEGAIRDIAGEVSGNTGSYFSDPEIVWGAVNDFKDAGYQDVFNVDSFNLENGLPEINPDYKVLHKNARRFIHLDLSETTDAAGIVIGYSNDDRKVISSRRQSLGETDHAPICIIEGAIAIEPPLQGQIKYSDIRRLTYYLIDKVGIPIKWVSADGFQSTDMLQLLQDDRGLVTKHKLSVEQEEKGYKPLKNAFEDGRVLLCHNAILIDEILHVVRKENGKIDHIPGRTKDISDGAAGVYSHMLIRYADKTLYSKSRSVIQGLYAR